ncbi:uncharacterized protein F5Z01DRAFT_106337 [Emericellopsis atlantica]|uniref:Uncharacterized protein n=1 Tax=Emericellopsis atlantica TaxID=2614577 RepID=A0A9P7ZLS2_9HYPO|nr:uncharacterized protein F5Z01DRAFT_106337 [Emericellopsis atlantica]KAG9254449.1 hypothetical protein F5Z01DRAFT_106337 [Emericellopsis atlantica]
MTSQEHRVQLASAVRAAPRGECASSGCGDALRDWATWEPAPCDTHPFRAPLVKGLELGDTLLTGGKSTVLLRAHTVLAPSLLPSRKLCFRPVSHSLGRASSSNGTWHASHDRIHCEVPPLGPPGPRSLVAQSAPPASLTSSPSSSPLLTPIELCITPLRPFRLYTTSRRAAKYPHDTPIAFHLLPHTSSCRSAAAPRKRRSLSPCLKTTMARRRRSIFPVATRKTSPKKTAMKRTSSRRATRKPRAKRMKPMASRLSPRPRSAKPPRRPKRATLRPKATRRRKRMLKPRLTTRPPTRATRLARTPRPRRPRRLPTSLRPPRQSLRRRQRLVTPSDL